MAFQTESGFYMSAKTLFEGISDMGVVQGESPMPLSDKEVYFWAQEKLVHHRNTAADW